MIFAQKKGIQTDTLQLTLFNFYGVGNSKSL